MGWGVISDISAKEGRRGWGQYLMQVLKREGRAPGLGAISDISFKERRTGPRIGAISDISFKEEEWTFCSVLYLFQGIVMNFVRNKFHFG